MLVVKTPEIPPTMKSLTGVDLTFTLPINSRVNTKRSTPTPNFKAFIFIEIKMKIPNGTPIILPIINLFNNTKSMSFRILKINDKEISNDKIIFICIASRGKNSISKKGVAIMEKPKPVLDCSMEATNIIHINTNPVPKTYLRFNTFT